MNHNCCIGLVWFSTTTKIPSLSGSYDLGMRLGVLCRWKWMSSWESYTGIQVFRWNVLFVSLLLSFLHSPLLFPPLLSPSLPFPTPCPLLSSFPCYHPLSSPPLSSSPPTASLSSMARTMVSHWTECWVGTMSIVCSWGAATLPSSGSLSCALMCWWNCSCLTTREASGTEIYTSTVLSWVMFAYKHVNYSWYIYGM